MHVGYANIKISYNMSLTKQVKTVRLGRKLLLQCAGMECPCTVTEDDFRSRPVNRVGKGEADG